MQAMKKVSMGRAHSLLKLSRKFLGFRKKLLVSLLTLSLLASQLFSIFIPNVFAASWWDSDWDYRFQYTIDNSNVGETLTDFPLHIDLTNDAPANFWTHVDSNGADIRIIDEDDSTNLSSQAHLEGWDYSNSQGHIWVKRTIAASGNSESIYIYYGNSAASTAFSDTTKQATYNDNYVGVWHLTENASGTGTTDLYNDATHNDNDGDDYVSDTDKTGQIDGGQKLDGSDYIIAPYNSSLNPTTAVTVTAWIKTTSTGDARFITRYNTSSPWRGYGLALNPGYGCSGPAGIIGMWVGGVGGNFFCTTETVNDGGWHYVAGTFDGSTVKLYIDGDFKISGSRGNGLNDTSAALYIGSEWATRRWLNGSLDEVRISNTPRSAEWIEFEYLSDSGGGGTAGSEEIGNTAPSTPTIDNFNDGSWTTDNTPTLQFDLSDPDSGDIVKYQIQIDDNSDFSSPVVNVTETSGSATPRNNVTYTPSVLSDGSYYWRVKGIDDESAESSWATANSGSIAFKVETVGPASFSPTANPSSWNQDTTPTITFSTTDATSGIDHYEVKIGSGGTYATQSSPYTLPAQSDGQQTVYVKAIDGAGNETEASVQIYVDATAPASFDLNSPGNNSYTNSERPSFKWKATTDATAGLSKYVLEIDNPSIGSGQPSGDFTIDSIPTSRTSDYETNKYVIHYENFSDSDSTNNYISVYTKSHSDWGTSENDGKLREGRISWKVKVVDNAGNETSSSRTLFVDRTGPKVEFTQVNDTPFTSSNFSTTDKTPTIYGKITDPLSGGDSSQTQDENGPKIASGPKQVDIKVEKKEGLGYKLITLYTINIDKPWYSCDNKEVSDNSKQKCDKYLPFEYTSKENLELGAYKITLTGKDKADNSSGETTLTLNITTFAQITTPEEKKIIEEETKPLAPEEKEKVKEELEITKPVEPSALDKAGEQISQTSKNILNTTGNIISAIFNGIGQGVRFTVDTTGKALAFVGDKAGQALAFVGKTTSNTLAALYNGTQSILAYMGQGIGSGANAVAQGTGNLLATIGQGIGNTGQAASNAAVAIGDGYNQLAQNAPGVAKTILTGIGNGVSTATSTIASATKYSADSAVTLAKNAGNFVAGVASNVGNTTLSFAKNTSKAIGIITSTIATTTSRVAENTGSAASNAANAIASATQNTVNNTKEGISNVAFNVGEKTQDVSDVAGFAIVKFGYLFVNEPTKIANAQVATLSPTSVKVTWETNHPANGKVNYGLDRTYPFDVQSEKRVTHHEFTLANLQPDTLYYFEVMSHNKNYVYDANREFRTPPMRTGGEE